MCIVSVFNLHMPVKHSHYWRICKLVSVDLCIQYGYFAICERDPFVPITYASAVALWHLHCVSAVALIHFIYVIQSFAI